MPQIYDKSDLYWTTRGDYLLGNDGDIMDTEYDPLRSVLQEVCTRASADQGDWAVFPTVGADIRDFVGETNNSVTAESIRTRLLGAIARDGFINTNDVEIKYMPIDIDKLLIRISITVAPTANNGNSKTIVKTMVYNYSDNNVYFIGR